MARRRLSQELLGDVAAIHRAARLARMSSTPLVIERWEVTPTTARQWVHKARVRGLLDEGSATTAELFEALRLVATRAVREGGYRASITPAMGLFLAGVCDFAAGMYDLWSRREEPR